MAVRRMLRTLRGGVRRLERRGRGEEPMRWDGREEGMMRKVDREGEVMKWAGREEGVTSRGGRGVLLSEEATMTTKIEIFGVHRDWETGIETGIGEEAGTETGIGTGIGEEAGTETGIGTGRGEEAGTETGIGEEAGTETGMETETEEVSGTTTDLGTWTRIGTDSEVREVSVRARRKGTGRGTGRGAILGRGVEMSILTGAVGGTTTGTRAMTSQDQTEAVTGPVIDPPYGKAWRWRLSTRARVSGTREWSSTCMMTAM